MMSFYNTPSLKERAGSAALYLGMFLPLLSWLPVIVIMVINIRKIYVKDFVKYHAYQAMLLNMISFALPQLLNVLVNLTSNIVSLFGVNISIVNKIMSSFFQGYYIFILIVGAYAVLFTLRARFTYIPPISQAVNYLLR